MNCASCGRVNRAGARFCGGCGKPLAPRCPACGADSEPDAQFCDACGTSLATRPADEAVARKVVTIVFADLIGSTSLHERLDAESVRGLMDRYYRTLHTVVEAHGGTVVKLLGDGVMAAFGVPRVAEDDAIRAVRAAVGMQRAFRDLVRGPADNLEPSPASRRGIGLRVAVNTGEVVVSADQHDVVGDPVNVAARLQQEARDGDVLIGESTRRLVSELITLAPLGALSLKGRSETVAAYRVVSLDRPAGATAIPFVGRDDELRRVMAVYDTAVAARRAHMAVILGSPGLGKSRLTAEFARRLGPGSTVLTARCDAAGGATFAPLAEALRNFLSINDGTSADALRAAIDAAVPPDEAERGRIAGGIAALLTGTPAAPDETFFVVRRFCAALAAVQPVVLVIDDLHWAEPLLLDLTEHLVQWGAGVPLLVLAAARLELRDVRASLTVTGGIVQDVVTLTGLDAGAATRLAASVVGAGELPAAVAGRVLATSEGNPLFLGELVRMLVEDGALRREGDRWVAAVDLAELEVPPTIHALLAARIERLRPDERVVVERAAVIGRQFSRAAVVHLLPAEMRPDLDAQLESLQRSELIEPDTGWFLGEPILRFHHALIRDAAYRRLLKGTRAELHGRFAAWIETRVGDTGEHDETIGWHLEQAHQHLRELGPLDQTGRAFGERAARYLAAAGQRALARDDLAPAASLLGRALDRLDPADPVRADLALDWCEALLAAGDVGPAAKAIDELDRFIGESAADQARAATPAPSRREGEGGVRLRAWHTCFAGQLALLTDPQALRTTAAAVAAAAVELAAAGDAAGEAKAHSVHALALSRLGKVGACEAALDQALAAARRAHDRRRANAVLAGAPLAALWGPSPVTRASGRCLDVVRVLRITQGAPAVEAVALRCQAVLEALRGRTEAARRMIASSRHMVEELGITQRLLEADVFAGLIELLEGDAVAAERCLRAAYEGLRDHGLGIDAAQAAALLGRALLAQGGAEEAEVLSRESEALAGDDLKAAIAWRGVRAEALALRGEYAPALELARAAVDIAATTDALLDHADARLALATALRAAGQRDAADAEEARAIELWAAKGATLLAERARGDSGYNAHVSPAPDEHATPTPHVPRRVRPNRATACQSRLQAAVTARDLDALTTLFADSVEVVHHPTGATIRREEGLHRFRLLFQTKDLTLSYEPLASLGDSLVLARDDTSFANFLDNEVDFGESRSSYVNLFEVDDRGLVVRVEVFAEDRLGDAVARLYERYADLLCDGPERTRAAATARSVGAQLGPFLTESMAAAFAPAVEFADHRTLGFGSMSGAQSVLGRLRSLFELSPDIATRVEDVLALLSDALLVRWTNFGTERADGGAYEHHLAMLFVFGADGLVIRNELFDADRVDAALARFDELTTLSSAARFANAASRSVDAYVRAWDAHDWQGVVDVHAPTARLIDRRSFMALDLDASEIFATLRFAFDVAGSRSHGELLATRGDRLALFRWRMEAPASAAAGRLELEYLAIVEVDASGRNALSVLFNLEDVDAAYAELDKRYAAEALDDRRAALTRAFTDAFAARDWDALATLLAPDLVVNDHRLLGWETLHGPAAYVEALKSLVDLAPDVRLRIDHVTMSAPRFLYVTTWMGSREGGPFESPSVILCEIDPTGLIRRFDQYDLDRLDEVRARFEDRAGAGDKLGSGLRDRPERMGPPLGERKLPSEDYNQAVRPEEPPSFGGVSKGVFATMSPAARDPPAALARFADLHAAPLRIPPNGATRASDRWQVAFEAQDWDALEALYAPTLVLDERRRFSVGSGDRDTFVASDRWMASRGTCVARTVLATAGDRLALEHRRWTAAEDAAPFEVETLHAIEIDAEGRVAANVVFDPGDRRAASLEMLDRYFRSEEARWTPPSQIEFVRALNDHDLDRARAALPDDFFFHDHRRTGVGRIGNVDDYIASLAAVYEQSPDATTDTLYHVAVDKHGSLSIGRMFGTLVAGGEFESVFVRLNLYEGGRGVGAELFEVEDLDLARARFEELRPG